MQGDIIAPDKTLFFQSKITDMFLISPRKSSRKHSYINLTIL